MTIITYFGKRIRAYLAKENAEWAEYRAQYRKCFEGTADEQERRLAVWDSVHRDTRATRTPPSLFGL